MNLLYEAQVTLEQAGYYIRNAGKEDAFFFEDQSLYGLVSIYASAEQLEKTWESEQDKFLVTHAPQIRANPGKAWNAYSVFLTAAEITEEQRKKLLQVEEDFRGTRKIARGGIVAQEDVRSALHPLLPIENRIKVEQTLVPKLEEKLGFLKPAEISALLTKDTQDVVAASILE